MKRLGLCKMMGLALALFLALAGQVEAAGNKDAHSPAKNRYRTVKGQKMYAAYRIFRKGSGMPESLFHGTSGSRTLVLNKIIGADVKHVYNPGKRTGPGFTSGWHVLASKKGVVDYMSSFKNTSDLVVSRVWVSGLRSKPRSRSPVYLAEKMLIDKNDWQSALNKARP